ncbi:MAG: arylesterase [Nannocystis sp.]|nr:arylesterase [Nannocystis sp.]
MTQQAPARPTPSPRSRARSSLAARLFPTRVLPTRVLLSHLLPSHLLPTRVLTARLLALLLVTGLTQLACGAPQGPQPAERPAPATDRIADPLADAPVLLALGDSLTAGLGLAQSQAWPALLQTRLLAEGYRYRVVNAGVSGDTSASGLARLDWQLAQKPAVVVLELGANDGLRGLPVAHTRENLAQIITRSKAAGAQVVLAGMQVPPNMGADYSAAFRQMFPELAAAHGVPLIPFVLEGVAGDAKLNQADGIHPTAEGQVILAETIWTNLRPLLTKSP